MYTHLVRNNLHLEQLYRGCNSCTYCTSGNYHQCPIEGMHTAIGIFHNGGWAQFCKVPAKQVHRIPDTMTFQQGMWYPKRYHFGRAIMKYSQVLII